MSLKIDMYISVADPAVPPPPPFPLLIFRPNWGPKRPEGSGWPPPPPPPYLRVWMTGGPPYLKVWIRRCILLLPTFLLSEIPHSLSCLASRRRPYFSFLSLTQIACRLVGFVDERSGNEIVFPIFFLLLFLYIFYWFHFFFFGYLLYPFYFWDHSFNWDNCQHTIAWAQNIFKAVYS